MALACKGHQVLPVEGVCSPLLKGGSFRCLLKAPGSSASLFPMFTMEAWLVAVSVGLRT